MLGLYFRGGIIWVFLKENMYITPTYTYQELKIFIYEFQAMTEETLQQAASNKTDIVHASIPGQDEQFQHAQHSVRFLILMHFFTNTECFKKWVVWLFNQFVCACARTPMYTYSLTLRYTCRLHWEAFYIMYDVTLHRTQRWLIDDTDILH